MLCAVQDDPSVEFDLPLLCANDPVAHPRAVRLVTLLTMLQIRIYDFACIVIEWNCTTWIFNLSRWKNHCLRISSRSLIVLKVFQGHLCEIQKGSATGSSCSGSTGRLLERCYMVIVVEVASVRTQFDQI